ncbi:MAG: HlyC/CorC family transporter [Oscillospiraceae bacterium]|nr:HlyC/CorC family transporter [Oscillospiraceae bacterium]
MQYAVIVLLLILSAFFSASETAFSSVNRIRLKARAEQGDRGAARALSVAERFDKALTAILVGNNIVNILSTAISTVIFTQMFGAGGVGISTAVMTVLVLIFGEILPKSLARDNAESFSVFAALPLSVIMTVLTPVTLVFDLIKKPLNRKSDAPSVTEDELKYILNEIEEEGVLEEREHDIVKSALEIDDRLVSEAAIPRVNIIAVEKDTPPEKIRDIFFDQGYSRLPVYEKTIDNITGYIHERDLFEFIHTHPDALTAQEVIHEVLYVTEFDSISSVLTKMQRGKLHMAVIKDQYGGTYGMVTMEDLIEEILGDIYDEADTEDRRCTPVPDGSFDVEAALPVRDFESITGIDLSYEGDSNTCGGMAMEMFGRIPRTGESICEKGIAIEITDAEDNRIIRMRIRKASDTASGSVSI